MDRRIKTGAVVGHIDLKGDGGRAASKRYSKEDLENSFTRARGGRRGGGPKNAANASNTLAADKRSPFSNIAEENQVNKSLRASPLSPTRQMLAREHESSARSSVAFDPFLEAGHNQ